MVCINTNYRVIRRPDAERAYPRLVVFDSTKEDVNEPNMHGLIRKSIDGGLFSIDIRCPRCYEWKEPERPETAVLSHSSFMLTLQYVAEQDDINAFDWTLPFLSGHCSDCTSSFSEQEKIDLVAYAALALRVKYILNFN